MSDRAPAIPLTIRELKKIQSRLSSLEAALRRTLRASPPPSRCTAEKSSDPQHLSRRKRAIAKRLPIVGLNQTIGPQGKTLATVETKEAASQTSLPASTAISSESACTVPLANALRSLPEKLHLPKAVPSTPVLTKLSSAPTTVGSHSAGLERPGPRPSRSVEATFNTTVSQSAGLEKPGPLHSSLVAAGRQCSTCLVPLSDTYDLAVCLSCRLKKTALEAPAQVKSEPKPCDLQNVKVLREKESLKQLTAREVVGLPALPKKPVIKPTPPPRLITWSSSCCACAAIKKLCPGCYHTWKYKNPGMTELIAKAYDSTYSNTVLTLPRFAARLNKPAPKRNSSKRGQDAPPPSP
jgi:hypothetical protein